MEGCCRRLELGVGFISLPEDLLRFIAAETFLSSKLKGLELGVGGTRLHLSITNS